MFEAVGVGVALGDGLDDGDGIGEAEGDGRGVNVSVTVGLGEGPTPGTMNWPEMPACSSSLGSAWLKLTWVLSESPFCSGCPGVIPTGVDGQEALPSNFVSNWTQQTS